MNATFGSRGPRFGQFLMPGETSALDAALLKAGIPAPSLRVEPIDSVVRIGTASNQAAEIAVARQVAAVRPTKPVSPYVPAPPAASTVTWQAPSDKKSTNEESTSQPSQIVMGVAIGAGFLLTVSLLLRLARQS